MEIKDQGQGRIFESRALELLSKAAPPVSVVTYTSIIIASGYLGYRYQVVESLPAAIGIFIGAIFFWTFFEYFFHRYVNHIDHFYPESDFAQKLSYTLHGIHHEYPRDQERIIMPPVPGLLMNVILFAIFYLVLGSSAFIFHSGFITGYMIYVAIHYGTHKMRPPKLLKPLWRHHALHHYKYQETGFGVSTTLWDRIFGTMPPADHGRSGSDS